MAEERVPRAAPGRSTFGWGFLGSGMAARSVARAIASVDGAEIVAVASRTHANAQAFAADFGVGRAHERYEQVLEDPEVDVVFIATPNHRHRDDAVRALEAGKAVLCEKPLATSLAEVSDIVEAARRHQVFCMEAMWTRFIPAVRKLQELVRDGTIGAPGMLTAEFGNLTRAEDYRRIHPTGGGALLDLGVYPLTLATMLLGPPTAVTAVRSVATSGGPDERFAAVLHHADDALALVSASLVERLPSSAYVAGSKGGIRVHSPMHAPRRLSIQLEAPATAKAGGRARLGPLKVVRELGPMVATAAHALGIGSSARLVEPLEGSGHGYQVREVMHCLRSGLVESEIMPLDETVSVFETVERIRRAWATGPHEGLAP